MKNELLKQKTFIVWLAFLFVNLQTAAYSYPQSGNRQVEKKTITNFSLRPTRQFVKSSFSFNRYNDIKENLITLLAPVQPSIHKIKESVLINLKRNCSIEILTHLIAELSNISNVLDTIQICTIPDDVKRLLSDSISEFNRFAMVACIKTFQLTNHQQYFEMAFRFAEKSKFRILSESMAFKHALNESGISVAMILKETNLSLSINRLQNEISRKSFLSDKESDNSVILLTSKLNLLYNEKKVLLADLDKNYPVFYKLRFDPYSIDAKSIRKALTKDQVILNYVFGPAKNVFQPLFSKGDYVNIVPAQLFCFLIGKDFFLVQAIHDSSSFLSTFGVDEFVSKPDTKGDKISISGYQSFVMKSHQLYLRLIEPFKAKIAEKSLLISLDQRLAGLPFDILISEMPESPSAFNFKNLHYLIQEYSISNIFTPGITFRQQKQVQKLHSILAFAPTYINAPVEELFGFIPDTTTKVLNPGSAELQEPVKTKEICRFLKSEYNSVAFINESATKEHFLKNAINFDILHLAMHGRDNQANPAESDMFFTPQIKDTGYLLNNYEIPFLRLNAGLVVLQSCQGGSSSQSGSERLQSPVRNFFLAGIPLGIASAWNLDDFSSGEILKSFYQYLFQGYRADLALSKAKLDFLKRSDIVHTQPYYWASLQCFGNPEGIYAGKTDRYRWLWILSGVLIVAVFSLFVLKKVFFR